MVLFRVSSTQSSPSHEPPVLNELQEAKASPPRIATEGIATVLNDRQPGTASERSHPPPPKNVVARLACVGGALRRLMVLTFCFVNLIFVLFCLVVTNCFLFYCFIK